MNFWVKSSAFYKALNSCAKIPFKQIVLYDISILSGVWKKKKNHVNFISEKNHTF